MKKKTLALFLALCLSLTACGGNSGNDVTTNEGEIPGVGESAGSGENSELPAYGGTAESTGGGNADDEAPVSGGEDAGTPAQGDVDLTAFYEGVVEENEWPALMALEGELLDNFYPGLSDLSLKQCLVYTAAISASVGEIALVEAETAEDASKAADIFQNRINYQVGDEENPGGAWYPATIEGWETTSRIKWEGNYVCMAVGDYSDAAIESFEALFS